MPQTRVNAGVAIATRYVVECYAQCKAGQRRLKWREAFDNLVVTAGLNELLDRLVGSVPSDVLWYVGLKTEGSPAAADVMSSHAGWSESSGYSEGARQAFTAGAVAAGSVDNSASKASFSINADDDLFGAFLASDNTKGGSSGTLYGVGDFVVGDITAATQANPCAITSAAHNLTTGNRVRIQNVAGMTELNGNIYTITSTGANSFTLDGIDSSAYTAYTSGGDWSKVRAVENGDTLEITLTLSASAA